MKSGIDYFPLDTVLDTKFELFEAEYGLRGFAVVIKLYQLIYGTNGYYCDLTPEVGLVFSRRNGTSAKFVSEVVAASCRRGIFNPDLYEKYQILTSAGVQKRYFKIAEKRERVEVKRDYLLLNHARLPKNVIIIGENADISSENVGKNSKNVDIFQQSKVKESKEKERRENGAAADFIRPPTESSPIDYNLLKNHPTTREKDFYYEGET